MSKKQFKFFIYGLSGAGKDTIANHLRDKYKFAKYRLATPIKSAIESITGYDTETLEKVKRTEPEIRKMHWKAGDVLSNYGSNGAENVVPYSVKRIENLLNKATIDFDMLEKSAYPNNIVFCDVRIDAEIEKCIELGITPIFINYEPIEFGDKKQKTEQDFFRNGKVYEWCCLAVEKGLEPVIIWNQRETNIKLLREGIMKYPKEIRHICSLYNRDRLLEGIDKLINGFDFKNTDVVD